nr:hypothetical protein CFP56_17952 [Quercus suber]
METRLAEEDIREVPTTLPPPELLPTTQAPPLDVEVSTKARKGMEVQPPVKTQDSEDTLMIKDVVSKVKDAKPKSKAGDSQSKAVNLKKDSHPAKA